MKLQDDMHLNTSHTETEEQVPESLAQLHKGKDGLELQILLHVGHIPYFHKVVTDEVTIFIRKGSSEEVYTPKNDSESANFLKLSIPFSDKYKNAEIIIRQGVAPEYGGGYLEYTPKDLWKQSPQMDTPTALIFIFKDSIRKRTTS